MEKTFKERFLELTSEVRVGKNTKNTYANFNYRTKPAILEAVKPIALKYGIIITTSSELIMVGEKYFVESTAYAYDTKSVELLTAKAQAELQPKAGTKMSEPQLTGSSDSYAGKYALGNLLGIDDNEDPDSLDNSQKTKVDNVTHATKTTPDENKQTEIALRNEILPLQVADLTIDKLNELTKKAYDLNDDVSINMIMMKSKQTTFKLNATTKLWE